MGRRVRGVVCSGVHSLSILKQRPNVGNGSKADIGETAVLQGCSYEIPGTLAPRAGSFASLSPRSLLTACYPGCHPRSGDRCNPGRHLFPLRRRREGDKVEEVEDPPFSPGQVTGRTHTSCRTWAPSKSYFDGHP
jgi:hypothetical protein